MKKVITSIGVFGPFQSVEILEDRYRCDGADIPFIVVGGEGDVQDASPDDFPSPSKTLEEVKEELINSTQKRLDDWAKTRDYSSILSVISYVSSTVPKFKAEAVKAVENRDMTWASLFTVLHQCNEGQRKIPSSFDEIVGELPELNWPD